MAVYLLYLTFSIFKNFKQKKFDKNNLSQTEMLLPVIPATSFSNGLVLLRFELFPLHSNKVKNVLLLPIRLINVFILSYESNPLLLYKTSYLVVLLGLSAFFSINTNLFKGHPLYYLIFPVSFWVLHVIASRFKWYTRKLGLSYGILCFLTSLSIVFFLSQIIKDFILFISFYLQ